MLLSRNCCSRPAIFKRRRKRYELTGPGKLVCTRAEFAVGQTLCHPGERAYGFSKKFLSAAPDAEQHDRDGNPERRRAGEDFRLDCNHQHQDRDERKQQKTRSNAEREFSSASAACRPAAPARHA
jgi:hypothetical protein